MLTTDIESAVNCAVYDIEKKEMKKEMRNERNQNSTSAALSLSLSRVLLRRFKANKKSNGNGHNSSGSNSAAGGSYNAFESAETCSADELASRLDEGRHSPLVNSELVNRRRERRSGVSERNETERKLVKQTLKNHIKAEYAKQYNFDISDMMSKDGPL